MEKSRLWSLQSWHSEQISIKSLDQSNQHFAPCVSYMGWPPTCKILVCDVSCNLRLVGKFREGKHRIQWMFVPDKAG
jgi:hypothetical protein